MDLLPHPGGRSGGSREEVDFIIIQGASWRNSRAEGFSWWRKQVLSGLFQNPAVRRAMEALWVFKSPLEVEALVRALMTGSEYTSLAWQNIAW